MARYVSGGGLGHLVSQAQLQQSVADERAYWQAQLQDQVALPPNMIDNAYMTALDGAVPVGFKAYGCTIEAVSPFTKGFQGVYAATQPVNSVTDVELATADNPMWYGRYTVSPQLGRAGFDGNGWGTLHGGHLLKITATPELHRANSTVALPLKRRALSSKMRFKAFVKLVAGSQLWVGADAGLDWLPGPDDTATPNTWVHSRGHGMVTKAEADAAPAGWKRVDLLLDSQLLFYKGSADPNVPWVTFNLGFLNTETIEIYVALPYLYPVLGSGTGLVE